MSALGFHPAGLLTPQFSESSLGGYASSHVTPAPTVPNFRGTSGGSGGGVNGTSFFTDPLASPNPKRHSLSIAAAELAKRERPVWDSRSQLPPKPDVGDSTAVDALGQPLYRSALIADPTQLDDTKTSDQFRRKAFAAQFAYRRQNSSTSSTAASHSHSHHHHRSGSASARSAARASGGGGTGGLSDVKEVASETDGPAVPLSPSSATATTPTSASASGAATGTMTTPQRAQLRTARGVLRSVTATSRFGGFGADAKSGAGGVAVVAVDPGIVPEVPAPPKPVAPEQRRRRRRNLTAGGSPLSGTSSATASSTSLQRAAATAAAAASTNRKTTGPYIADGGNGSGDDDMDDWDDLSTGNGPPIAPHGSSTYDDQWWVRLNRGICASPRHLSSKLARILSERADGSDIVGGVAASRKHIVSVGLQPVTAETVASDPAYRTVSTAAGSSGALTDRTGYNPKLNHLRALGRDTIRDPTADPSLPVARPAPPPTSTLRARHSRTLSLASSIFTPKAPINSAAALLDPTAASQSLNASNSASTTTTTATAGAAPRSLPVLVQPSLSPTEIVLAPHRKPKAVHSSTPIGAPVDRTARAFTNLAVTALANKVRDNLTPSWGGTSHAIGSGNTGAATSSGEAKRIGWSRTYTTNRHSVYARMKRSNNLNFGRGTGRLDPVSGVHGFLSTGYNIRELCRSSGYNRRELYLIFVRFKALCALRAADGGPVTGIDKHTFQHGVSRLSVEDDRFVNRVFAQVDVDSSGQIEFEEFVRALSALEKGSLEDKVHFFFRIYNVDGDKHISRDDLRVMFLSSSMLAGGGGDAADQSSAAAVAPDQVTAELVSTFVDRVFAQFGKTNTSSTDPNQHRLTEQEIVDFMRTKAPDRDVWEIFGRSMLKDFSNRQRAAVPPTAAADPPSPPPPARTQSPPTGE